MGVVRHPAVELPFARPLGCLLRRCPRWRRAG